MPKPGVYRFECKQYENPFVQIIDLQQPDGYPFNNVGWEPLLQLRTLDDDLVATALLTYPTDYSLQIQLGEAQCLAWPLYPKRYLYDLRLASPSEGIGYWLEGDWIIRKAWSRPV